MKVESECVYEHICINNMHIIWNWNSKLEFQSV